MFFSRVGIKKPKKPTTPSTKGVRSVDWRSLTRIRERERAHRRYPQKSSTDRPRSFSLSQMDPKFLRNQKYAKKGSLKAAGKK